MDLSRRGVFSLPIALPFILAAKPVEAKAPETKADDFTYGCCAAWVSVYNARYRLGHVGCSDGRYAFIVDGITDYDPKLMVPGTKVFVHWKKKSHTCRAAEIILPWKGV